MNFANLELLAQLKMNVGTPFRSCGRVLEDTFTVVAFVIVVTKLDLKFVFRCL